MKAVIAILALMPLVGGCTNGFPDSPLNAATQQEARCTAIRENTPVHERGTRSDPTTDRTSGCAMSFDRTYEGAPATGFHPFRDVLAASHMEQF